MNQTKEYILFKLLTALLVFVLFLPTTVKLSHTFSHHKHEVCLGGSDTHFHTIDLDCEFQKFQLQNIFTNNTQVFKLFAEKEITPVIFSNYHFLSDFQRLHFSLRGPPSLI